MKHLGFSLIELIVVIILLGVLSAFALPRFANLSDQSHDAVAESFFSSFQTATKQFYALCQLRNGTATGFSGGLDIPEYQVRSSTSGSCYPEAGLGDGRISDLTDCVETWQGMLDPSPTLNSSDISFTDNDYNAEASNSEVIARYVGTRRCAYYYVASQRGTNSPVLNYNGGTGDISISNL